MSRYPNLSWLFPTFLEFSRLFHLLISATILKNPDNTKYPCTQKVRINFPQVPQFYPDLSRFVSVTIPTSSTRPNFFPCHPNLDFSPMVEIKMLLDLHSTRPDFCQDLIPLEISRPQLVDIGRPAHPPYDSFFKSFPPSFQNCYDCSSAVRKTRWKQSS